MVSCDLCGRETSTAYIIKIEGATLVACPACAERGEVISEYRKGNLYTVEESGEIVEDFAQRIKEARKKKRLKLGELSELTGIKPHVLKLFEEGRAVPTPEQARRLEKALGIELLESGGEGITSNDFELTLGDVVRIR